MCGRGLSKITTMTISRGMSFYEFLIKQTCVYPSLQYGINKPTICPVIMHAHIVRLCYF